MSSNKCNATLLTAIFVLGSLGRAEAQAPVGTRAAGMAGAFVGVADDASAVYWNPAGIATGAIVSALAMFGTEESSPESPQASAGERHTARFIGLSLPPIGLAYYRLGAYGSGSAQPAVTTAPSREEVRRSVHALTTSVVGVSLLQSISQFVVIGVTPKVVRGSAVRGVSADPRADAALDFASELDGRGETTFDVDAGVMLAVSRIRLGLVARNLTTPAFAEAGGGGGEIALSREVRIGGAWGPTWPGTTRWIVSVDGDLTSRPTPRGDRRDVAAGVESWWRGQRFGVRGGVRRSTIGEARGAVTAGISAAVRPTTFVEAHVVSGSRHERGWSAGLRMGF